jgi:hypothetical protein
MPPYPCYRHFCGHLQISGSGLVVELHGILRMYAASSLESQISQSSRNQWVGGARCLDLQRATLRDFPRSPKSINHRRGPRNISKESKMRLQNNSISTLQFPSPDQIRGCRGTLGQTGCFMGVTVRLKLMGP